MAVTLHIFSMPGESCVSVIQLDPATVLFNELKTDDPRWKSDDVGYNFLHRIPPDIFPEPGQYQLEYEAVEYDGSPIMVAVVHANILKSLRHKRVHDLNETQMAALRYLRANGPVAGKNLAKEIGVNLSTLRRHIIPALKRYGVKNDRAGDGYYISQP